ncbi:MULTISPECIES: DUF421 domain-containing protein [Clostridium]|mgnify:CR=1 FL=1|jgi:uncharacterized membrane protein YcaP (DUF421 family)|uniref:DUF421 domain-containing protein n=2 Tax=Clostridium TaxID=1485 RepID=A0A151APQ7_9CLOT|nr:MULTISPECIES: DUF421 domain-containing protein [Clostridium]KYH29573.1 hypothetical protein CLCOL_08040 [Clostridium colicanis DSM 13634]MBE6043877.1 DUF421 domain-containing protein [Clostridium thermopalmarium]PRR72022.1 hypothetical protein CPAL_15090 [Clostridium thermopalmarium DSM 5974]PVZ23674.1 uncharacterized membrane protein YcaP (DUF421 family) [Clostridium thermopalmarium DSM 5974]
MNEALIVLVRGIIGFFSLLIFARILGKQQISQLTFFDYILGITIGSTASTLTTDLTSTVWCHWVGLLTWTVLSLILQFIALKSKRASDYLDDKPTIIIMNGKILESSMKKLRYRLSDLLEQLRDKGVFDLNQVAFAILEKDGQLSVLKKPEYEPVTPKDLNLTVPPSYLSSELIYDGIVIEENLKKVNKDMKWLDLQLKAHNVKHISDVFIATYNPPDSIYIDLYKDHIQ